MSENRFRPTKRSEIIPQSVQIFLEDSTKVFTGWENLRIRKSLTSLSQSFSFSLPQKYLDQNFVLSEGTKVSVFVNDERVITGRIDRVELSVGPGSRGAQISGRTLNADLVDCSATGPSEYQNIHILDFARELVSPFGLKVFNSLEDAGVIQKIGVRPGDTVFQVLDKAARMQGGFWISTRAGNIRLTRAGRGRSVSAIHEKVNMKSGSAVIDGSQRYSRYTVKGQQPATDGYPGVVSSTAEGTAKDLGVSRFRPLIMVAESTASTEEAKKRASWEASRRLAEATQISVTVQGWLQEDGTIWGINQITPVRSQSLGVDGDLLSVEVEHVRDFGSGTITNISFTRKDAFTPNPAIPKKKTGGSSLEALLGIK